MNVSGTARRIRLESPLVFLHWTYSTAESILLRMKNTGILFVCHGNICRSPMAEFVMKKLANDAGAGSEFRIDSAATSTEELGNGIHPGTEKKLRAEGVPVGFHRARQITSADYENYDFLVGMDVENLYYMEKKWNNDPDGKVSLLLSFAGKDRDIADPWYTGNFDRTYDDVLEGCSALLKKILGGGNGNG